MRKFLGGILWLFFAFQGTAQSWKALYDSTEFYWDKDWNKCVALLEDALPLAARDLSPTSTNYLVLMNDLGLAYLGSGDYSRAQELFVDLVQLKRESLGVNSAEYAASLVNLAGIYQDLGEGDKAEPLYLEAIENYKVSLGDQHPDYATAIQHLGQLYESQARYSQAESLYLNAVNIRKFSIGSYHPNYAGSLSSLGRLYRTTGDFEKSRKNFEEALEIFDRSYGKEHPNYVQVISELGILYQAMGQYATAEKYLVDAVSLRKSIYGDEHRLVAEAMNNLASLYKVMGNYQKAELNYRQAERIFEKSLGATNPDYGTVLNNLGDFYVGVLQFEKARPYYEKAASILKAALGEAHPLYSNTLNNLASLNRKTGNFSQAEVLYRQSLALDEKTLGKTHPAYATSLNNLAILYVATKKYQQAEPLYKEALRIKKAALGANHPSYAKSLNNLGLLYMTLEDYEKAEPLFLEAVSNQLGQIKTIFPVLSEKEREDFYNTLRSDLERFNTFAVLRSLDNPSIVEHMYNNQLITKALLFNAGKKMRNSILESGNQSLIGDFDRWRDLRENLASLYQLPKMDLVQMQEEMTRLEEEANQLEKSLARRSVLFAREHGTQPLSWRAVQRQLGPNEAAVEIIRFRRYRIDENGSNGLEADLNIPEFLNYGFTNEILYAALIIDSETTDRPKLVMLENGGDLEGRFLSYYKNAIHYVVNDFNSYRQYWEPIASMMAPGVDKVFISPDGVYNKINLNTIRSPQGGNYLIDEMAIYPITSTRDLLDRGQEPTNKNTAVLVGNPDFLWGGVPPVPDHAAEEVADYLDPLPGTDLEVREINNLMARSNWSLQSLTGGKARENSIKELDNPRVLHIATHGYFTGDILRNNSGNELLNSGLLLAGSSNALYYHRQEQAMENGEDGVLTAYEAMNLNLDRTELVVLSACETGLGTVKNGEGVYGLQRAFKVAGARSIIISLWRVDDTTTKKLLTYFYENWLQHGDKHRAFKDAQIKLRQEYLYPYYWGAFIMAGI